MKIELYGFTDFDRSGKVRWLLNEVGQSYQDHWVKTDADQEKFLKVNPMGQIPVVRLDGELITESGAICAYLSELFPEKGPTPEINSKDRAAYLQWLFFGMNLGDLSERAKIVEDIPDGEIKNEKSK